MHPWKITVTFALLMGAVMLSGIGSAQSRRVTSPAGSSATEIGGRYDERVGYEGGRWLELQYGRPIRRGRDLFGPSDFAEALSDGAPVWRAGANMSTRLTTEVPIVIEQRTIAPGEYTLFIELAAADSWTLIVSTWPAQTRYDEQNLSALWGAYGYTRDRDVVRAPMRVETLPYSFDQLSWQFLDMSDRGGRLALLWDRKMASVAFAVEG
jgi:hypothetical protein